MNYEDDYPSEDWTPPFGIPRPVLPAEEVPPPTDFADYIDPLHEQSQAMIWLIRAMVRVAKARASRWEPTMQDRFPKRQRYTNPYPLAKRPKYCRVTFR